jgi:hypothetical protein
MQIRQVEEKEEIISLQAHKVSGLCVNEDYAQMI